ncbi:MAG: hypothetical protein ACOY31_01545 [Bacillota bacterium]
MNIKDLSYLGTCMRALCLSIPLGAVMGYILYGSNIYVMTIVSATVGMIAAIGLSLINYRQLVTPIKRVMDSLEKFALKSGVGVSDDFCSIAGLEKAFFMILEDMSLKLEGIAERLNGIVADLSGYMTQVTGGAAEAAGTINNLTESTVNITERLKKISRQAEMVVEPLFESNGNLQLVCNRVKVIAGQNEVIVVYGLEEQVENLRQVARKFNIDQL